VLLVHLLLNLVHLQAHLGHFAAKFHKTRLELLVKHQTLAGLAVEIHVNVVSARQGLDLLLAPQINGSEHLNQLDNGLLLQNFGRLSSKFSTFGIAVR